MIHGFFGLLYRRRHVFGTKKGNRCQKIEKNGRYHLDLFYKDQDFRHKYGNREHDDSDSQGHEQNFTRALLDRRMARNRWSHFSLFRGGFFRPNRGRTDDLLLVRQSLYQLSYWPDVLLRIFFFFLYLIGLPIRRTKGKNPINRAFLIAFEIDRCSVALKRFKRFGIILPEAVIEFRSNRIFL